MAQSPFADIFNYAVILNSDMLDDITEDIEKVFQKLQKKEDLDSLKVLRNKLMEVLQVHHEKLSHSERKYLGKLEDMLEDIDEAIQEITEKNTVVIEEIDPLAKFDKKYKKRTELPEKKKKSHILVAIKKSEIAYERNLLELQLELMKLQKYVQDSKKRVLIIFEWRDAAGKWWSITRFTELLNPRSSRVVALPKPTDIERGQWYFQRYIQHLPNAWEMVFFDRSWYNRAGVEPVMGFVNKSNYEKFMGEVASFEKILIDDGIELIKFYFSISKWEQAQRFQDRKADPLKQYKLSPVDQSSQKLWDRYTLAEYRNFQVSDTKYAPWTIIESDDKKEARLNAIRHLLSRFDYPQKSRKASVRNIDDSIVLSGKEKLEELEKEVDRKLDFFE